MTKQAGGNEAASLTNAVLGSVLGVFVSQALIFWLLNLGSASNPVNYIHLHLPNYL
jgi:predicted Na+-dependent transporter